MVAECEPLGGEILAGYAQGRVPTERGVLAMVLAARANQVGLEQAMRSQMVALDESRTRWLLPGLGHPREAEAVPWDQLTDLFARLGGCDVIADCGRWATGAGAAPLPLLREADVTVLLTGAATPAVWAVRRAARMLRDDIGAGADLVAVAVGAGHDRHTVEEITAFLQPAGIAVVGELGHDPRTAAVFSEGAPAGRGWQSSRLLRDAAALGEVLRGRAARRCARLDAPSAASTGGAW